MSVKKVQLSAPPNFFNLRRCWEQKLQLKTAVLISATHTKTETKTEPKLKNFFLKAHDQQWTITLHRVVYPILFLLCAQPACISLKFENKARRVFSVAVNLSRLNSGYSCNLTDTLLSDWKSKLTDRRMSTRNQLNFDAVWRIICKGKNLLIFPRSHLNLVRPSSLK